MPRKSRGDPLLPGIGMMVEKKTDMPHDDVVNIVLPKSAMSVGDEMKTDARAIQLPVPVADNQQFITSIQFVLDNLIRHASVLSDAVSRLESKCESQQTIINQMTAILSSRDADISALQSEKASIKAVLDVVWARVVISAADANKQTNIAAVRPAIDPSKSEALQSTA